MNGMLKIKLDNDCIKYMGIFESMTGAHVKDCVITPSRIVFVVKSGQAGLAIGKAGSNIRNLKRTIKKDVEIIEFADDLNNFLNNLFRPMLVNNLIRSERNGKTFLKINLLNGSGLINRSQITFNSKVKKAKFFVKKYFGIDELILG
jgi:N utilization substance protein A